MEEDGTGSFFADRSAVGGGADAAGRTGAGDGGAKGTRRGYQSGLRANSTSIARRSSAGSSWAGGNRGDRSSDRVSWIASPSLSSGAHRKSASTVSCFTAS